MTNCSSFERFCYICSRCIILTCVVVMVMAFTSTSCTVRGWAWHSVLSSTRIKPSMYCRASCWDDSFGWTWFNTCTHTRYCVFMCFCDVCGTSDITQQRNTESDKTTQQNNLENTHCRFRNDCQCTHVQCCVVIVCLVPAGGWGCGDKCFTSPQLWKEFHRQTDLS